MSMSRREFLAAGLALHVGSVTIALEDQSVGAQGRGADAGRRGGRGVVPARMAKTTRMFKSPGMYPNALAVMTDPPGRLWIGQQKVTVWHEGRLISCDAGIHPGWKGLESPHRGYIFSIEIV